MDEKQVAIPRDEKEVLGLEYSDKQLSITTEKQAVNQTEKIPISTAEKEVVLDVSQLPVAKSFDVLRMSENETQIRGHETSIPAFKITRKIKKNLLKSNEHIIAIFDPAGSTPVVIAKVQVKNGEIGVSSLATAHQALQGNASSYGFVVGQRSLAWERTSMGTDLGACRLLDMVTKAPLAMFKTSTSVPGQVAQIDYFECIDGSETEVLSLAAIFGILEGTRIAGERDDDHGGGNRKFGGVDPGNAMDMGGVGGGGMM